MITYLLAAHFTGIAVGVGVTLWLLSRTETDEKAAVHEAERVILDSRRVRR